MTALALEERVLAHYRLVGPLLDESFGLSPIVFANFPGGFGQPAHYHRTDVPLSASKLLWLCHRMYAVEFHSCAPLPEEPTRLRFARILLEDAPFDRIKLAALALRALLTEVPLEAVPLLDGLGGMALWIPLADAPDATILREWLHGFCAHAVATHPKLFTTEPNTHANGRVHLHVASNAPHKYSVLPYSARGRDGLPVCTPIHWDELGTIAGPATVDTIEARLKAKGDVFRAEWDLIKLQRFSGLRTRFTPVPMVTQPRGSAITAALDILEDGVPRTADAILTEALRRKLVQPKMTQRYVYTSLIEYITRCLGQGRKPLLVQDPDRTFRLNEPLDDWPALDPLPQPPPLDTPARALLDRLDTTANGDDPAAFERAVCDAFAHLGFAATHVGGHGNPDGYADAQLGVLGYRVMIECKTAKNVVTQPDCVEAAKFKADYNADYCILVGPDFPDEQELGSELQTHAVTAVTTADLRSLIQLGANAFEIEALLRPGFLCDHFGDFVWDRMHGARKRLATVAHLIRQEGWKAQVTAAQQGGPKTAPLLTVDAAMLLVDAALRTAGSKQACTREEVEAAFAHLTDPLVGEAIWSDASRSALVITADLSVG